MRRKDSPFPKTVDFAAPNVPITGGVPQFEVLDGVYRMFLMPPGVSFTLDRVRRDHHELIGELAVHSDLAGARKSMSGALLTADFNLSSARARVERAKLLTERARSAETIDWLRYLEEFCERVHEAERRGQPAIPIREIPLPAADEELYVDGILLLRSHPVLLFGDGGAAKSYLALYFAGLLEQQGLRVLYADWELAGHEHRDRLGRLFPTGMPNILYARCERPLVHEIDRLRQLIAAHQVSYVVFDSVAFACDGPPEAAEIAGSYFRALRQLNIGSLHIAHITKGGPDPKSTAHEQRPFGSTFWHNGARATWFARKTESNDDASQFSVGLYQKKANLGPLATAVGFQMTFHDNGVTSVSRVSVRDNEELAEHASLYERIAGLLKTDGALTIAAIAERLDAKANSVQKVLKRRASLFKLIKGADGIEKHTLWLET